MRLVSLALAVALAACSHATPYKRMRLADVDETGYADKKVAPDEYVVAFFANCRTSRARAFDFALLRAAEVGVREGFPYFAIEHRKEATSVMDLGSTSYGTVIGNSVSVDTYRDTATCPAFALTVRYFREPPRRGLDLFGSGSTAAILSRRYGVKLAY